LATPADSTSRVGWKTGSGTAGELGSGLARTLLLTGLAVAG
jgi:hypothetical protein